MSTSTPKKPDFHIRAIRKGTQEKAEIGVGWKNEDGSIFLKFNPFVVVPVGADYAITAFPPWKEGQQDLGLTRTAQMARKFNDDDIPF